VVAASSWVSVGPAVNSTGGVLTFGDSATDATRFYRIQAR